MIVGRIDYHAGRDQVHDAIVENAAGDMMQFVDIITNDHRVPRIGPSLITDHEVLPLGQQIDELTLGLIAPLQSNHALSGHLTLRFYLRTPGGTPG